MTYAIYIIWPLFTHPPKRPERWRTHEQGWIPAAFISRRDAKQEKVSHGCTRGSKAIGASAQMWNGAPTNGVCPAGGEHTAFTSPAGATAAPTRYQGGGASCGFILVGDPVPIIPRTE